MVNISAQLEQLLPQMGLSENAEHIEKINAYIELLLKWNKTYNLIGNCSRQELLSKHILDSLSVSIFLTAQSIIDVGTGAGLPGIPLAIFNPDKQFMLIDSNNKKTRFLVQTCHELKLDNIKVVNSRVELFQSSHCFDIVISRAFAAIEQMLSVSKHLICPSGKFFAMKGKIPTEELAALAKDFKIQLHELKVPGLDAERHLVILEEM